MIANSKRLDIKEILSDPELRKELVEGATDFICKVEGVRSDEDSLALRVQRLESMYETAREALLDAYRQIDDLKQRIDRHYIKIHILEEIIELGGVDQ